MPKCEKCGSEMVEDDYPGINSVIEGWVCPLDPKDCRIKALERQLEEAKKALTWEQGVAWAAAELIRAHGADAYAEWLLRCGVSLGWSVGVAEEDMEVLHEAAESDSKLKALLDLEVVK